ncbi:unnamed protein product [Durusdinium trenchii]|uniref:RNA-editing substrate-binding complex 6 protein domain-containing protein n=1 Tax=Durusdinium trenchii TaxID=1381693 RepID=A0ABP0J989_9DINO
MSRRSRRLAQDIAAAPSAHAAWELLRSQANFDQIHVAACLHRMATQQASPPALQELLSYVEPEKLDVDMLAINCWSLAKLHKAPGTQALWRRLVSRAELQRPEFSARHLSNLLWSVARCRETEAKSLLEELPRQVQDMSPQGLANCFWAISKLQGDNLQVVDVLANEAKLRASELKAQDLTSILWSASTFAVRFNDLIRVLAEHAAICAPQQSARQLTNAAWALATVSPEQMRKTVEIIVQKALQRGPLTRDLCNLSWALAAVRGQASPLMVETIEGSSCGLQHPTVGLIWALCVTRACAGPLLMAGVRTGRLSGGPAEVAQLLWCQATVRATGSELLTAATEHLPELSSVDVSRCVWAAAILESELPAAKQLVLQAAEVSLHDAATVVQVSWSLTRLQLYVPQLLERFSFLEALRPQDMALGAWVLAFWHFVGNRTFFEDIGADLTYFGAQDLSNLAWAMAIQLVTNEPLVVAIAVAAQRKISSEMTPQHLCNLIWSFAAMSWSGVNHFIPTLTRWSNEVLQRSHEVETLGLAATSWSLATATARQPRRSTAGRESPRR